MKISVITVSYNSALTILDTIRSVAVQNHVDFEHIVVDGKSTDATVQIARENQHSKLEIASESDDGIYDAMNKGLKLATGDVLGFLNADDIFADRDVLSRIATVFSNNPPVEVCFGDLVYVSHDNSSVIRYWKSCPFLAQSFSRGWCPPHPTFYVRRSALERLGYFNLSYRLAADTEFMLRYLECGAALSVYIPAIQVRMRVGGATNRSLRNILTQNLEIFRALAANDQKYSVPLFLLRKLLNRIKQRFSAYVG